MTNVVPAMREWIVDRIKRSGPYRKTLYSLSRECKATIADVLFVEPHDTISRDEIALEQQAKLKFLQRRASSSGTSGRPLIFPQPLSALQSEQAFIDFLWLRRDFRVDRRVAVMRGTGGFSGTRRFLSRLIVSSDGWKDEDIQNKYHALCKFKPEFIDCYPSILERLISKCHGLGLADFPDVVAVFAGSEACTTQQEELFKKYLNATTISWYGQSEQVALGLKVGPNTHHFLLAYSDLAFIRHDQTLEIAGRSKLNPFFSRQWYRTGDFCDAVEIGFDCNLNMSVLIVKGLSGRNPEYVITEEGDHIPLNQIIFGLHGDFWLAVSRYCFVQEEPGVVKFYYAENSGMSAEELIEKLRARLPRNTVLIPICSPKLNQVSANKWRYYWPSRPSFLDAI